jgi:uncharacterized protein
MSLGRALARPLAMAAFAVLLIAGAAYFGLCLWFAANERGFVFHPMQRASMSPRAAGLSGVSAVSVPTEDGNRLYGWWAPPKPGQGAIVLLIGKNVALSDESGLFGDLAAHGFGVIGIDYRGDGASTGAPSQAGLRADARAAFDYAHRAAPQAKIAVLGESLGTWPAIALALDRPAAGVLLNSPFASLVRLFELRGPLLPYRLLMSDPLDSEALIGRLRVPVMILHGTADHSIPIAEARRLYAAAHAPKTMIEVKGAGHAATWFGATREGALAALASWTAR